MQVLSSIAGGVLSSAVDQFKASVRKRITDYVEAQSAAGRAFLMQCSYCALIASLILCVGLGFEAADKLAKYHATGPVSTAVVAVTAVLGVLLAGGIMLQATRWTPRDWLQRLMVASTVGRLVSGHIAPLYQMFDALTSDDELWSLQLIIGLIGYHPIRKHLMLRLKVRRCV